MKKRTLSILAALCAAACVAGGCGSGNSGSILILDGADKTDAVRLTVYGNFGDRYSLNVIEDTLQKFMSENSVIATYESAGENVFWQALDRRHSSGNLDDIFAIEHDRLTAMSAEGLLCDLSDIVNDKIFNDFARSQITDENGKIYAVPTSLSTYGLYVNYDLLQKNNLSVPSNLDEFGTICDIFKDDVTPIICNNYSSLSSLIVAVGMYDTYCTADLSGEIEKFNLNPSLIIPQLERGINFVFDMIEKGWIDIDQAASAGISSGDAELFATGKYPFMITGGWISDTLKETLDNKSLSYAIYPYPVLENSSVLVAKTDLLSVRKGENETEAKKLLSYLTNSQSIISLNENRCRFSPLNITQINADATIMPSANSLFTKGKYVVYSDNRLSLPVDSILRECTDLILYEGADAATVKDYLALLINGFEEAGK